MFSKTIRYSSKWHTFPGRHFASLAGRRISPTTKSSQPLNTLVPNGRHQIAPYSLRYYSSDGAESKESQTAKLRSQQPQYMMAFTCKVCDTRSSHVFSKQAYHHGSVLISCPGCNGRHLIADHLKIFSDTSVTIEQIMHAKGESVNRNSDDLVLEDIPESLRGKIAVPTKGTLKLEAPSSSDTKSD